MVVFCPNIGVLCGVVLSLVPMLLPFCWQSLLLPVLPATQSRLEIMEVCVVWWCCGWVGGGGGGCICKSFWCLARALHVAQQPPYSSYPCILPFPPCNEQSACWPLATSTEHAPLPPGNEHNACSPLKTSLLHAPYPPSPTSLPTGARAFRAGRAAQDGGGAVALRRAHPRERVQGRLQPLWGGWGGKDTEGFEGGRPCVCFFLGGGS